MNANARRLVRSAISLIFAAGLIALFFGFVSPAARAESRPAPPPQRPEMPEALMIPEDDAVVTIDGNCDYGTEYAEALQLDFEDAYATSGTIYLKQGGDYLYACLAGVTGGNDSRFARVYLDTDNERETWSESDDIGLQVDFDDGALSSYSGAGGYPGGYNPATIPGWTAAATEVDMDQAEFQIPITLTGGLCGKSFGLAVYHHHVDGSGDDYGWPSNTYYDYPNSWTASRFAAPPCSGGYITIPQDDEAATLDGSCDSGVEYGEALSFNFTEAGGAISTVYLKQDMYNLFVCMTGTQGTFDERYARLYLDTDNGQEIWSEADDIGLQVDIEDDQRSSYRGAGGYPGGYNPATIPGWTANASSVDMDMAEYQVPLTLTGGTCGSQFGLALYHHDVDYADEMYGWPESGYFDGPFTWRGAKLEYSPCPAADLSLEKSAAPDPVEVGAELTYQLTVTNQSGNASAGVLLTDVLPAGVELVSVDPVGTCVAVAGVVTCGFGSLPGGGEASATIVVHPTAEGTVVNSAEVGSTTPDSDLSDNSDSVSVTVNPAAPAAGCGGTFTAVADTVLLESDPNTPQGFLEYLQVLSNTAQARSLIAFELGEALPKGSYVDKAALELVLYKDPAPAVFTVQPYSVQAEWSEAEATWANQPEPEIVFDAQSISYPAGAPAPVRVALDVTTLVNLWASGEVTQTVVGLQPHDAAVDAFFDSREKGVTAPRLVIGCASPPPEVPPDLTEADLAQEAGIQRLRDDSSVPPVIKLGLGGSLRHASLDIPVPSSVPDDNLARAWWFFETYYDALRLEDPASELQLVRTSDDRAIVYYRQLHAGIPVAMAELGVVIEAGRIVYFSGNYVPDIAVDPNPLLSAEEAEQIALLLSGPGVNIKGVTQLRYLNMGLNGSPDQETYLAWRVPFAENQQAFIDARSGAQRYRSDNHIIQARPDFDLDIDTANNADYSLNCAEWYFTNANDNRCDEDGCDKLPPGGDTDAERAFSSIGTVYWWWWNNLGRDSYGDDGEEIVLYTDVTSNSIKWRNAHFIPYGDCMEFGDGYTTLDIIAHEYGHAVTDHRWKGDEDSMTYENESGAINDSFADILAHFVDNTNWWVGEALSLADASPGCRPFNNTAMRSMADPTQCNDPDRLSSPHKKAYVSDPNSGNDRGGVHSNSGITNKAFYLITDGQTFNGFTISGIGQTKANRLFYRTMQVLPTTADFASVAYLAVNASLHYSLTHQYGFTYSDVCQVRNAFAAVEVSHDSDVDCDQVIDSVDPDNDDDMVPDGEDNCDNVPNFSQANADGDYDGDACETDDDNDGWLDANDNCPTVRNSGQEDMDNPDDGRGDACDDSDNDRVVDARDNCWMNPNRDQRNSDLDSDGDACDADDDNDLFADADDNCPTVQNPDQANKDGDNFGNACDLCPNTYGNDNGDPDKDGLGNDCDDDDDNDGVPDTADNCREVRNPGQFDFDHDGLGLDCDDDDTEFVYENTVPFEVQFNPNDMVRFPMPDYCTACGGGYLPYGYETQFSVNMAAPFFAQVVNSSGVPVANTRMSGNLMSQVLSYSPAPYTFNTMGGQMGPLAPVSSSALAANEVSYWLEVIPPPGVDYNQTFTMTIQVDEVPPNTIYLPVIRK